MKATEQLKAEHEGIRLMLSILERVCERLESGQKVEPGHLDGMLEFFKVFVDTCHHGKEEDFLFPAMEAAGVPKEGGPIGVMLMEHEKGRGCVREMGRAASGRKPGSQGEAGKFIQPSRDYIGLLTQHIDKENNVLFVMADQRLSEERQEGLYRSFERLEVERIGEGRHEAFHRLLDDLKRIYLG